MTVKFRLSDGAGSIEFIIDAIDTHAPFFECHAYIKGSKERQPSGWKRKKTATHRLEHFGSRGTETLPSMCDLAERA